MGLALEDPLRLSSSGEYLLSQRDVLQNDESRAEYELMRAVYFSGFQLSGRAESYAQVKESNLLKTLAEFVGPRRIFLDRPRLLVLAELISSFPGALVRLQGFDDEVLIAFEQLGQEGFREVPAHVQLPPGGAELCKRIGTDYTRAEERRLHQIVSMALLTIKDALSPGETLPLHIPQPYSNLLTEEYLFEKHLVYSTDLGVWPDGVNLMVSNSPEVLVPVEEDARPSFLELVPLRNRRNSAPINPRDPRHQRRRSVPPQVMVPINTTFSEKSEDFVGNDLRRHFGERLIRAGHTDLEASYLPDGMVPGADFFVLEGDDTISRFVEVKTVYGAAPFVVSFTRAEYARAIDCARRGVPYDLVLVELSPLRFHHYPRFEGILQDLELTHLEQFSVLLRPRRDEAAA